MAREEAVELLKQDVQRGEVAAKTIGDRGQVQDLNVESTAVTVRLPSGEPYQGYVITAFDPDSRLFWWTFQGAGPGDPEDRLGSPPAGLTFFVSSREIVGIELGTAPPSLWILRSTSRVESLEEGRQAALDRVAASAREIEQGTVRWMRTVSLVGALPMDFYYEPSHSMPGLELTVTSVERVGGRWRIGLEGREGRTAELLLNELFVLESAQETT